MARRRGKEDKERERTRSDLDQAKGGNSVTPSPPQAAGAGYRSGDRIRRGKGQYWAGQIEI